MEKKTQLSGAILDMKFMKKSKERVEKEQDDAEGNAMYSNDITDQMRRGQSFAIFEVSINNCKDLIEGRLSFGGLNQDVQRLMQDEYSKRIQKIEKEKEVEISDLEMAKRYNPAVETMGKKFNEKKINKQNHKRKFMKPSDD